MNAFADPNPAAAAEALPAPAACQRHPCRDCLEERLRPAKEKKENAEAVEMVSGLLTGTFLAAALILPLSGADIWLIVSPLLALTALGSLIIGCRWSGRLEKEARILRRQARSQEILTPGKS